MEAGGGGGWGDGGEGGKRMVVSQLRGEGRGFGLF